MKKAFSLLMALIFLSSSLGFAIGTHYCGDHAVINKVVLGSEDLACGMDMMRKFSKERSEEAAKEKGCCENEFQDLKIKDDFESGIALKSPSPEFVLIFAITYTELFIPAQEFQSEYKPYFTHAIERDIPVLFQSLLI